MSTPYWFKPKSETQVDVSDPNLIRQGEYLARAGDCIACHTAPGGKPFAGGLGMQTPMGTIYSTNITPDRSTGIGAYSYGDFERAVRKGIRRDGTHLYPAMPYVSYAIITDDDMKGLYAYFMSGVDAVQQDNQPTTMPWPLSMRWPIAWWQLLFAQPRQFANDSADPQILHGAYLVEGLAHCGACHTPRGLAFEETALVDGPNSYFLSGSVLEGWYAKNLRNEDTGLSTWTTNEIIEFLRTGRNDKTAAFGSMSDVIEHSTQHLSVKDLTAIAVYLKSLTPRDDRKPNWKPKQDVTTVALKTGNFEAPGAASYVEHCAICHRMDGKGALRIYPALAGNSMVFSDDPSSLIQVTLAGGRMPKTPHDAMAFTMPGFAHLTNREIADILNFIRNGWGNHGSKITDKDISRMRHEIARKPKHYVPGDQHDKE
ncbi:cytochrome c [Phyllobacterium phragmitis]|nr:cytochrome c [Phyllobacterium phragmitis]